jgi:hypothetical protein
VRMRAGVVSARMLFVHCAARARAHAQVTRTPTRARTQVPTIGRDNRAVASVDEEGIDGPAAPKDAATSGAPAEGADGKKLYTGAANYQKLGISRLVKG